MRELKIKDINNYELNLYIWDEVNEKDRKAIIQLNHGISEHLGRYDEFARFLNMNGYICVGSDHIGHGKSTSELGRFYENPMEDIVCESQSVYKYIKRIYKDEDIILFGHSMGSFVSLRACELYCDRYKALILCGTNGKFNPVTLALAKATQRAFKTLKKDTNDNFSLNKLLNKVYNKRTLKKTDFDWLNRNEKEVQKYLDDKLCGFNMPNIFILSLMKALGTWYLDENISKIQKDLPILLISGTEDPVGEYSKGVIRLKKQFSSLGINNVYLKLYEGARHEILLEDSKYETFNDVLSFLNKIERK